MIKLNYFNFKRLGDEFLLTNDFGDQLFLSDTDFKKLLSKEIQPGSELERTLLTARMIYASSDLEFSVRNHHDLREIKGFMAQATSLHIFVVTTACNLNCVYCQANSGTKCPNQFMDKETAERAVDIALQSPAHNLSFEFQGGEPLMNFDIIKRIVYYAEEHKGDHEVNYSVVTNLTLLNNEMMDFFEAHHIGISTSIDGSQSVHDENRPYRNGLGSFADVVNSIKRVQQRGLSVGAIETTTKYSLPYAKEIIAGYRNLGFDSIFIRPLTPLGKANLWWNKIGYTPSDFLSFYRDALSELIRLNLCGVKMRELHASILLKRIRGFNMNYMELRSPCGGGIGQLAYFADGRIFTCDEGRMLAEMGDESFLVGNVHQSTYQELMRNGVCRTVCASSILETIPSCCDCVYQPYCGTCPVVNYALQNDVIERKPHTYRCQIYAGILDTLFEMIRDNDAETMEILRQWSDC